ncbi:Vesicular glutamate transporter 2.1 [Echinococcus granulosus]|nr:Vesicular glutamate transporter 2.1 [Echinococcus granulosus]
MELKASAEHAQQSLGAGGVEEMRQVTQRRLHRRQTTLDAMPPPHISPDGFPIYKEPPHADAPDVGMKVNILTRIVHILMCRCTKRYYTAWMCSLGFLITFGIRCNMSWVTLAMEHHTHLESAAISKIAENITITTRPNFYWTPGERGFVESAFFYGYMITQIPGGAIATIFPANRLFGIAVGGSALCNLIVPIACRGSYGVVAFIRVLQGLVEGVSYPACHGIWRYWAPPIERSRLATIAFCGSYAGAVMGLFVSGIFAQYLGWQSPFYLYAILGMVWFAVFWKTSYEKPSTHPKISAEERDYIEESIGEVDLPPSLKSIPWKSIFTSMPVYAIIVANIARSWSFFLLIMKCPKYLKQVFECSTAESGVLSSVPHLIMAIIVPISGQLADRLRKRTLTTTAVRKIFNCGGFGMEAFFLLIVAFANSYTTAMASLILAVSFSGFAISGYNVNHLDIAPRYASILMGLSNGIGTISGILCPVIVEYITTQGTKRQWMWVFIMASSVHFFGVTFYAIFASGEKQHWAEVAEDAQIMDWKSPTDVPENIVQSGYDYGNEEGALRQFELTELVACFGFLSTMAKSKLQISKQRKNEKEVKAGKTKAKVNFRERILTKQLRALGKVGGVIDKRVGTKDSSIPSSDAALRRHIIEKLRQMDTLGTISVDDDLFSKAAMGAQKTGKHASFDDDSGGLSADIVENELFAGGLITAVESGESGRQSKNDSLLERIAQTKEERLKRVEENEVNRQKLKNADSEWADKVRFMLAELSKLKPKNAKAAEKMEKGRSEVLRLLQGFSSGKTVAPIGVKVESEVMKNNRLLVNLESIVARRVGEENSSMDTSEHPKTEDVLLRLLCSIRSCEPIMVSWIAGELRSLIVTQLSDVVRGLLLTQILLMDVILRKLEREDGQSIKLSKRACLNGVFVPEAIRFLSRLINEVDRENGVLFISEDASSVEQSVYSSLDTRVALRQRPIPENEVAAYRLGCLDKCLSLTNSFLEVYTTHLPAPAVCQAFSGLSLDRLSTDRLPAGIEMKAQQLRERVDELRAQPRPEGIGPADKIALLLADKNATPQALQKAGLVPQLEPDFEQKLDARRPKKKPTNVKLRQKLAKERRDTVRELRRDAQFLANYDRKKTKAGDKLRKRKTQAIIASMRSIE